GAHDEPKPYHIAQDAKYAAMIGAPHFAVVYYYPSTQARYDKLLGAKVSQPHIDVSRLYDTAAYLQVVSEEYARLREGLEEAMPEGDATDTWRCRSCRFSGCERNDNARNPRRRQIQHAIGKNP
ncbi:MAG: hypothetical protein ACREML_13050, partial [Vulcanimicrobiaceae bacterium]